MSAAMKAQAPQPRVPVRAIAALSFDGKVYRAFDHLIGAQQGRLALVPIALAEGKLTAVVDLCPVPWGDVLALLDDESVIAAAPQFAGDPAGSPRIALADGDWRTDLLALAGPGPRPQVVRWTHPAGIRYAVTCDLLRGS